MIGVQKVLRLQQVCWLPKYWTIWIIANLKWAIIFHTNKKNWVNFIRSTLFNRILKLCVDAKKRRQWIICFSHLDKCIEAFKAFCVLRFHFFSRCCWSSFLSFWFLICLWWRFQWLCPHRFCHLIALLCDCAFNLTAKHFKLFLSCLRAPAQIHTHISMMRKYRQNARIPKLVWWPHSHGSDGKKRDRKKSKIFWMT